MHEILLVLSRALIRPGGMLAVPSTVRLLHPTVAAAPAAELMLDNRSVLGIAGWARAMVPSPAAVIATRAVGPAVMLKVVGQLAENGPTVIVVAWVNDWPIEMEPCTTRAITPADLFSVALNALGDEDADTVVVTGDLAGVR